MPLFAPTYSPGFQTQKWYHAQGAGAGTGLMVLNQLIYAPLFVGAPRVFDAMSLQITVAASSNSSLRLGVYQDSNGFPGSLVLDAGTITSSCAGSFNLLLSSPQTLQGEVWLAAAAQGTAVTQPTVAKLGTDNSLVALSAVASLTGNGWTESSVTGALPASATPASVSAAAAAVMIRAL